MTFLVPDRKVGHLTIPGYRAGNSNRGDLDAKRRGCGWTDLDVCWTKDRVPINTHWLSLWQDGFAARSSGLRWSRLTWDQCPLKSRDGYALRTVFAALTNAHHVGLNVELEAKERASVDEWRQVAEHCEHLWGRGWRAHVNVKCLTTLTGWSQILHDAHAAGFRTLVLVRGTWRTRRIDKPWITYVRGSSLAYPKEPTVAYTFARAAGAPSSTRAHYGHTGQPTGITIHHWGELGQTHDGVVKYLTRDGAQTSAHEVISAGRVTHLVDFDRAAWHAGSTEGNGKTIGLECRPEMSPEDWQTLVERCADIEEELGSMRYYRHSDWKATACPGKYGHRISELIAAVNAEHARRAQTPTPPKATGWQLDRARIAAMRKKYARRPRVLNALNELLKGAPKR